jgi:hypothetical protein
VHVKEAEWITEEGYKAVVNFVHDSHNCGYVGVPPGHPLFGKEYNDLDIECHGGLTYAGTNMVGYPVEEHDGWHYFGFDCAHLGDATKSPYYRSFGEHETFKDVDYCARECDSISRQLKNLADEAPNAK